MVNFECYTLFQTDFPIGGISPYIPEVTSLFDPVAPARLLAKNHFKRMFDE